MKTILVGLVLAGVGWAQVRVGAAWRKVTPDLAAHAPVYMAGFGNNRVATEVHDELTARCVALEAGRRAVVICGVDSIGLFWDDVARIRERVPGAPVVVAALHTHEAPDTMGLWGPRMGLSGVNEAYNAFVVEQVAAAAREALETRREARLKAARVAHAELDGFIADTRPPVVHDSELVILKAEDGRGQTIATLVNWANHPEALGSNNTLLTADYAGYLYQKLEQLAGGTVVLVNGALGGMQSPLGAKVKDPRTGEEAPDGTFRKAEIIGERVAEVAAEGMKGARRLDVRGITFREEMVKIPLENEGYKMAAAAGVFKGRKIAVSDGTVTAPVGLIRVSGRTGALVEMALVPGEMYPELSVGGVERYEGADYPEAVVEKAIKRDILKAPYRMVVGLANDEIGYIIPKGEWDAKAPWLKGAAKRWYGEVNSVGPEAGPAVAAALERLAAR